MLLVLPLILAPISAQLSCGWYLATPDEAVMTPPGYVALLNSRFDLNFPGESQGPTDTKGLAAPSGKDPEVLGKSYNSLLLTLGVLLAIPGHCCQHRHRADSKKLFPPHSCPTPTKAPGPGLPAPNVGGPRVE